MAIRRRAGTGRGKSYAEYTAEKQGTSYKAKLKTAIDNLIPRVKDFDELLRRLQEMGYEIKQGKYISFRAAADKIYGLPAQRRSARPIRKKR